MSKVRVFLLVLLAIGTLGPSAASARLFRRGYRYSNSVNYQRYVAPTYAPATTTTAANATAATESATAEDEDATTEDADAATEAGTAQAAVVDSAAPATTVTQASATTVSYSTSTAQGVANLMARYGRVGHFGGNPGYEGCGCGSTPQAAYNICCYGNSGMATVDVGYARGSNGMWYCCRRYR